MDSREEIKRILNMNAQILLMNQTALNMICNQPHRVTHEELEKLIANQEVKP